MDPEFLKLLPLHDHPEFLRETCDLINEEWPRSETARLMSLKASCDTLPTSLILVNEKLLLLGHCKLTPIPAIPESCFIETVVIRKSFRGQKLGTYLMKMVEDYCRNKLKLSMLHLSTKGQEKFYEKLGYTVCAPVSIYGSQISKLLPSHMETTVPDKSPKGAVWSPGVLPPPPPPMPIEQKVSDNIVKQNKTFMLKHLCP